MLIGAKTAAWSGGGKPTARDYVQNGLLYMIDGTENVGYGQHSSNPSEIWTAGSYTSPMIPHDIVFEDDRMIFNGSSSYAYVNSHYLPDNTLCVEGVFKFSRNQSGMIYQSSFGSTNQGYSKPELCWHNSIGFITAAVNEYNAGTRLIYASDYGSVSRKTSVSVNFEKVGKNVNALCLVKDGAQLSVTNVNHNGNDGTRCMIGANGGLTAYFLAGEIYCVRLYDHALSEQERAANYAIDQARFGLA